ncbi:MAG: hypothetical protein DDT24_00733 [Chloroflexi bacterium]|nr:hypothetical protein [Chloroflexota bacterium]
MLHKSTQGHKLAGSEEFIPLVKTIEGNAISQSSSGRSRFSRQTEGYILENVLDVHRCFLSNLKFRCYRRTVLFPSEAIHHHSGHLSAQSARHAFSAGVLHGHSHGVRPATDRAPGTGAGHGALANSVVMGPALSGVATYHRLRHHIKINAGLIMALFYLQAEALIVLVAQPQGLEQRQDGAAVLAGDGARPQVSHGGLSVHCGVEALQVLTSPPQYPVAPGSHVPGEVNLWNLKHLTLSSFLLAPCLRLSSVASAFQKPFHELWRLQGEGRQGPGLPRKA